MAFAAALKQHSMSTADHYRLKRDKVCSMAPQLVNGNEGGDCSKHGRQGEMMSYQRIWAAQAWWMKNVQKGPHRQSCTRIKKEQHACAVQIL